MGWCELYGLKSTGLLAAWPSGCSTAGSATKTVGGCGSEAGRGHSCHHGGDGGLARRMGKARYTQQVVLVVVCKIAHSRSRTCRRCCSRKLLLCDPVASRPMLMVRVEGN